jgi:hypothetical protein
MLEVGIDSEKPGGKSGDRRDVSRYFVREYCCCYSFLPNVPGRGGSYSIPWCSHPASALTGVVYGDGKSATRYYLVISVGAPGCVCGGAERASGPGRAWGVRALGRGAKAQGAGLAKRPLANSF